MKKLLTLLALAFLLILALPTPALAQGDGILLVGIYILGGIWVFSMIIAIIMTIIIATKISRFETALFMVFINGMFFFISSSICFVRRDFFSGLGFFCLTFAAICLLNVIIATFKNSRLSRYKYIVIGIFALYIILPARAVWNIRYQTPCIDAIKQGNEEKVLFCIKKLGINKKIMSVCPDKYCASPKQMIYIAAEAEQPEIIKLLINNGSQEINYDIIRVAAGTGDIDLIKKLLDDTKPITKNYVVIGNSVQAKYIDLSIATKNKQYDMLEFLISRGTDPESAIKTAIKYNDEEMVNFLLNKGFVDINLVLWYITAEGNIDKIKEFLNRGANININAKNKNGKTALDLATKTEIKDLLRSYGAKTSEELKQEGEKL